MGLPHFSWIILTSPHRVIRAIRQCMADLPLISRTRGLARVPFGLLRCDVAEGRVDALPIVVALDVGEQVAPGFVPGCPSSLVSELDLEGQT